MASASSTSSTSTKWWGTPARTRKPRSAVVRGENRLPTSWRPMGNPSSVNPAGTEIAGWEVTVIREQERIHSR